MQYIGYVYLYIEFLKILLPGLYFTDKGKLFENL